MKIDLKKIDKLNSTISISIEKKDYENKVDSVIKDYKSKINLPGFRKGHVPLSLIRKKYEKAIIVEETNKILSESLNKYIVDNSLKILGNPVPILDEKWLGKPSKVSRNSMTYFTCIKNIVIEWNGRSHPSNGKWAEF